MAYKTIRDIVSSESHEKALVSYNERLWVLNSFLDMVGCVVDVARHKEETGQLDAVGFHPMSKTIGGKADKLLDSTVEVIGWIQEVMFDDRRDYATSTHGQNEQRMDGEYSMT